jgi:hypothetical protein
MDMIAKHPPDLPPDASMKDGQRFFGPTGQLWEVRNGQWAFLRYSMDEINRHPPPRHYLKIGQRRDPWDWR